MTYISDLIRVLISQDRKWPEKQTEAMYIYDSQHIAFEALITQDFSEQKTKSLLAQCTAHAYAHMNQIERSVSSPQQDIKLSIYSVGVCSKAEFAKFFADFKTLNAERHENTGQFLAKLVKSMQMIEGMMVPIFNRLISYGLTPKRMQELVSRLKHDDDPEKNADKISIYQTILQAFCKDPKNEIMELVHRMSDGGSNASDLLSRLYDEQTLSEIQDQEFVAAVRLGLAGDVGPKTIDLCYFLACLLG